MIARRNHSRMERHSLWLCRSDTPVEEESGRIRLPGWPVADEEAGSTIESEMNELAEIQSGAHQHRFGGFQREDDRSWNLQGSGIRAGSVPIHGRSQHPDHGLSRYLGAAALPNRLVDTADRRNRVGSCADPNLIRVAEFPEHPPAKTSGFSRFVLSVQDSMRNRVYCRHKRPVVGPQ